MHARGGNFMVVGPRWHGEKPRGIDRVIRSETSIASAQFRTQLFNPGDLDKVRKIQDEYVVRPLSAFLGRAAPRAAPPIDFISPLSAEAQKSSLDFFRILNFTLQFAPAHPSERALRERLARIGVAPGKPFDPAAPAPEIRKALEEGIADAWADFAGIKKQVDAGKLTSGDLFGTRTYLNNDYLRRMTGVVLGIYGNSKEEAIYPAYFVDSQGRKLDGNHRYTLRFPPGWLPPVNAFWSLTMYEQPASLLVANPIDRYLLNSTMLDAFVRDADGGITLHLQHGPPERGREANWLPAPQGPFSAVLRLYLPKAEALDGRWTPPALLRVD